MVYFKLSIKLLESWFHNLPHVNSKIILFSSLNLQKLHHFIKKLRDILTNFIGFRFKMNPKSSTGSGEKIGRVSVFVELHISRKVKTPCGFDTRWYEDSKPHFLIGNKTDISGLVNLKPLKHKYDDYLIKYEFEYFNSGSV